MARSRKARRRIKTAKLAAKRGSLSHVPSRPAAEEASPAPYALEFELPRSGAADGYAESFEGDDGPVAAPDSAADPDPTCLPRRTLNSPYFDGERGANFKSKAALENFESKASLDLKCDNEPDPSCGSHLRSDALADFVLGDPIICLEAAIAAPLPDLDPLESSQFNPFEISSDGDPPFDVPDEADLAAAPIEVEVTRSEPPAQPAVAPPAPRAAKPRPPPPPPYQRPVYVSPASTPEGRAYLAQARVAALRMAPKRAPRRSGGAAASIAVGLGMPLMLAGIWAITEPGNNLSIVQPLPSAAAAAPLPEPRRAPPPPTAPTPAPTPDPLAQKPEYDAALHEIEAGRADAGIAMLRNAADGGYVMAQYRLAKIYERGEGVPRNLTTAREWAERAARGGNRRAMHDVGVYFAQGEGAPHDEAAAFRWFREAAAFGVADSQYNLGLLYQQGRGVSVDAQEALFWFLVAAHHGEINAADRAVEIAAGMSASSVAQTRSRARAFQAREPDAAANG